MSTPDDAQATKSFNREVKFALDAVIFSLMGPNVLSSLYKHLKEHYNVDPDEVPYRLETMSSVLESVFGLAGVRTIEKATAKRLYNLYHLDFVDKPNYRLQDYLEQAKKELAARSGGFTYNQHT